MTNWQAVIGVLLFLSVSFGCAGNPNKIDIPEDAVKMDVSFSWQGIAPCIHDSPEIRVSNIPEGTKWLTIRLTNLSIPEENHGGGKIENDGSGRIPPKALDIGYNGPCPTEGRNTYEFMVLALDEQGAIIGFGSAKEPFPPK